MMIRNGNDLKNAYIVLIGLKEMVPKNGREEVVKEHIKSIKRDIRGYFKKKSQKPQKRLVKDNGIDGFIELIQLPGFLKNVEDAKEYFDENEVMICRPSMYDCTGQLFTCWYKIIERHGRMFAYHCVGCDV